MSETDEPQQGPIAAPPLDGAVNWLNVAAPITIEQLRGKLQWQPPALERLPLLVGFTAPRPGQPDWAQIYERGLRDLLASGEYRRILERHNVAPD